MCHERRTYGPKGGAYSIWAVRRRLSPIIHHVLYLIRRRKSGKGVLCKEDGRKIKCLNPKLTYVLFFFLLVLSNSPPPIAAYLPPLTAQKAEPKGRGRRSGDLITVTQTRERARERESITRTVTLHCTACV